MSSEKQKSRLVSLVQVGAAIHQLNRRAEEKLGISVVQWCLLHALVDMPGTTAFSLAQATGVHPSTLTQSLKRLQRKGFVFVGADPKDLRRKIVSMTRLGKQAVDVAQAKFLQWDQALGGLEKELGQVRLFLKNEAEAQP